MNGYLLLAGLTLAFHLLWILWVIFGALFTRGRPLLAWLHVGSLVWGLVVEAGPWPCPLTLLEQWLQNRAGIASYQGAFLIHYLDRLVYPNISARVLIGAAIVVCAVNLSVYVLRWRARSRSSPR